MLEQKKVAVPSEDDFILKTRKVFDLKNVEKKDVNE